jgi:hypothetical protein
VLLTGREGADGERSASSPRATATPTPTPPGDAAAPGPPPDTQVEETGGRLAVGITEPNPSFVWAPEDREVGGAFGRWRAAFARIRPAYYRLVLDWPSLQPSRGAPADLAIPNGGCLRDVEPCASWAGVREQLEAAASRQRRTGMQVLVVVTGSPDWAARPAGGCERAGIAPRSRPPRAAALEDYRRLVSDTLAAAREAGVELRYWSAWNEPNHPYFLSPQRRACAAGARTAAVGPYVAMARALREALDAAPGEQAYVIGELAGLLRRKPQSTGVREFARALPDELVCGAAAWTQHAYVPGPDPVDAAARGLASHRCDRAPEIWITETGVGAAKLGASRPAGEAAQRAACRAMDRRLRRWFEDPRVTAAFQYTLREDDKFPTGLVKTRLDGAYPVLRAWERWGGSRPPGAAPPKAACGQTARQ